MENEQQTFDDVIIYSREFQQPLITKTFEAQTAFSDQTESSTIATKQPVQLWHQKYVYFIHINVTDPILFMIIIYSICYDGRKK